MSHFSVRPITVIFALLLALPALSDSAFQVSGEHTDTHPIHASKDQYTISVGGTADMDNTATRQHATWTIAFQNNIALVLENTGDVPVKNPRVITNDKRKWYSVAAMLKEFTQGAKNDQDRIYLIWEGLRQHRHHDSPLFGDDFHDPVRFLNIYGGGLCDDSSASGAALYSTAGFNKANGGKDPFQRGLHGHVMCEVWYDGDYQFMDIDQDTFFLDRENRKPISGDTATRDHDYARRELVYGPVFPGWSAGIGNAALFGRDDVRTKYWSTGFEMDYTLRPGERVKFYWDRPEKTPWELNSEVHRFYSNSKLIYALPADPHRLQDSGVDLAGFEAAPNGFTATSDDATITIPVTTCYTICGGALDLGTVANAPAGATATAEVSLDGKQFKAAGTPVQLVKGAGEVPLDTALGVEGGAPKRNYWVRLHCNKAQGATLSGVTLRTDVYAYPIALPRLFVGQNTVAYTDATTAPHELTITYRWRESGNVTPPVPPASPQSPAPSAESHATYIPFSWPAVPGCDAYDLRVSRDPAFRYPYRPNYDTILPDNHYQVPFRGMFSPGETYYWHVRPRLASGLWGGWSPTWTFTWTGPTVPKNLSLSPAGNGPVTLRWSANTRGNAPARYRVYASNERGFSIGNADIQAMHQGPKLAMVETVNTSMVVAGPSVSGSVANHAFYRVVAIDAAGVESCPSDYAELPQPFVYSAPVTQAKAGAPYQYQIETVASMGDFQHRYDKPGNAYWEQESDRYEKAAGPEWLQVDPDTGLVHGTPPAGTKGEFPVVIHITTQFAHEVPETATDAKSFRTPETKEIRTADHHFKLIVSG